MRTKFPVHWLAKFALGALSLLIACGWVTTRLGNMHLPSATTRDGTQVTMNRYLSEPIPHVVLVGSSITFRLKEEYFATPDLRNLALAGGSPVTGLEIVGPPAAASQDHYRRKTNILPSGGRYDRGRQIFRKRKRGSAVCPADPGRRCRLRKLEPRAAHPCAGLGRLQPIAGGAPE